MDLHIYIALFFFIFRIPNIANVAPESQNLVMEFVGSDKTSEHTG